MGKMQVLAGAEQLLVIIYALGLPSYERGWSASLCNPLFPERFQASAAT